MTPGQGVPSQHPSYSWWSSWGSGPGAAFWSRCHTPLPSFPLVGELLEDPPWSLSFPKSCPLTVPSALE